MSWKISRSNRELTFCQILLWRSNNFSFFCITYRQVFSVLRLFMQDDFLFKKFWYHNCVSLYSTVDFNTMLTVKLNALCFRYKNFF